MPKGVYARPTVEARFWAKVDKVGPEPSHVPGLGPCWVWTASTFARGLPYGQFQLNGRPHLAHRVAWLLTYGRWPNRNLAHRCDNPRCVRVPDHLFEATPLENNQDMNAKGRNRASGKLSRDQVERIIHKRASGETGVALAAEYGVSDSMISMIWRGREWASIDVGPRPVMPTSGGPKKLTAADVREIRRLRESGLSLIAIARKFSVSGPTVHAIVHRRAWSHVC